MSDECSDSDEAPERFEILYDDAVRRQDLGMRIQDRLENGTPDCLCSDDEFGVDKTRRSRAGVPERCEILYEDALRRDDLHARIQERLERGPEGKQAIGDAKLSADGVPERCELLYKDALRRENFNSHIREYLDKRTSPTSDPTGRLRSEKLYTDAQRRSAVRRTIDEARAERERKEEEARRNVTMALSAGSGGGSCHTTLYADYFRRLSSTASREAQVIKKEDERHLTGAKVIPQSEVDKVISRLIGPPKRRFFSCRKEMQPNTGSDTDSDSDKDPAIGMECTDRLHASAKQRHVKRIKLQKTKDAEAKREQAQDSVHCKGASNPKIFESLHSEHKLRVRSRLELQAAADEEAFKDFGRIHPKSPPKRDVWTVLHEDAGRRQQSDCIREDHMNAGHDPRGSKSASNSPGRRQGASYSSSTANTTSKNSRRKKANSSDYRHANDDDQFKPTPYFTPADMLSTSPVAARADAGNAWPHLVKPRTMFMTPGIRGSAKPLDMKVFQAEEEESDSDTGPETFVDQLRDRLGLTKKRHTVESAVKSVRAQMRQVDHFDPPQRGSKNSRQPGVEVRKNRASILSGGRGSTKASSIPRYHLDGVSRVEEASMALVGDETLPWRTREQFLEHAKYVRQNFHDKQSYTNIQHESDRGGDGLYGTDHGRGISEDESGLDKKSDPIWCTSDGEPGFGDSVRGPSLYKSDGSDVYKTEVSGIGESRGVPSKYERDGSDMHKTEVSGMGKSRGAPSRYERDGSEMYKTEVSVMGKSRGDPSRYERDGSDVYKTEVSVMGKSRGDPSAHERDGSEMYMTEFSGMGKSRGDPSRYERDGSEVYKTEVSGMGKSRGDPSRYERDSSEVYKTEVSGMGKSRGDPSTYERDGSEMYQTDVSGMSKSHCNPSRYERDGSEVYKSQGEASLYESEHKQSSYQSVGGTSPYKSEGGASSYKSEGEPRHYKSSGERVSPSGVSYFSDENASRDYDGDHVSSGRPSKATTRSSTQPHSDGLHSHLSQASVPAMRPMRLR